MLVPRTLIFLTQGEKVLLLKGADTKRLWAGRYNGVGGHIEQGEDILASARRELFEETGVSLPGLWLCGIVTIDTQTNPGVGVFVFKGEYQECAPVFSNEGTLKWIELSEIYNIPLVPDLPLLLPKIFAHQKGLPPFFAHSEYDESGNILINFS